MKLRQTLIDYLSYAVIFIIAGPIYKVIFLQNVNFLNERLFSVKFAVSAQDAIIFVISSRIKNIFYIFLN